MRRETKRRAMHDRDALGFEQIAHEIFVAVDPRALRRLLTDEAGAGRVDVERALRPRAVETGHLVQQIDDEIARLKLETMGITIDQLSEEQARYLESWDEGT